MSCFYDIHRNPSPTKNSTSSQANHTAIITTTKQTTHSAPHQRAANPSKVLAQKTTTAVDTILNISYAQHEAAGRD